MMDLYTLLKTALILAGVIALMVGLLYGYKKFMHLFPRTSYMFGPSPIHIDYRYPLDPRRQILRIRDDKHHYTLLLGETNLILDKSPLHADTICKEDLDD